MIVACAWQTLFPMLPVKASSPSSLLPKPLAKSAGTAPGHVFRQSVIYFWQAPSQPHQLLQRDFALFLTTYRAILNPPFAVDNRPCLTKACLPP
ncbi:uncharacterized protein B0I36DRAFT_329128 [Microdochium trichocladiopsis]|uniref:Uncharacterized protein n=1 Tax=Microdochium trichocladiopsis TaxID=1682393 RepID=A0A9P8Y1D6_9PEZI|nr:uncharacterized protein B0I36DRAFT_329128 [Microdochium trichocladiopsis]KAH7025784.1 hypothetical protein B0I36DRAFT_329128 [Microdochium trichocladiopsis]